MLALYPALTLTQALPVQNAAAAGTQIPAATEQVARQPASLTTDSVRLLQALQSAQPSLLFGARKSKQQPARQPESTEGFQPILAVKVDFEKVQYPVIVSPKIDGNRGLVKDGKVLGRSMLAIPNPLVQKILARPELEGLDGELIASEPTDPMACRKATAFLRSKKPTHSNFQFWVFDVWNQPDKPFQERIRILKERVNALPPDLKKFVKIVPQHTANSEAEILQLEKQWLKEGYEGAIIRKADAPYINTRSTMVDQAFMKLKRFYDSEAQIIGFRPLDPKSELAKSMLKAKEITEADLGKLNENNQALGGYMVRDLTSGAEFNLGAGQLTFQQRQTLWKNRQHLSGKVVKYKYFPVGMSEDSKIPRHPTFLDFRENHDMPADLRQIAERFKQNKPNADDAE